jgi:hypothetical protein
VEDRAVLLERFVAQPIFEDLGLAALGTGGGEEGAFIVGAEGGGQQVTQAGGGGLFAVDGREADDAVGVGEAFEAVGIERGAIRKTAAGLARPAVAQQAGERDVERLLGAFRVAVEKPLRRVAGIGFGQAVRVFLGGDALPVAEVEGT